MNARVERGFYTGTGRVERVPADQRSGPCDAAHRGQMDSGRREIRVILTRLTPYSPSPSQLLERIFEKHTVLVHAHVVTYELPTNNCPALCGDAPRR